MNNEVIHIGMDRSSYPTDFMVVAYPSGTERTGELKVNVLKARTSNPDRAFDVTLSLDQDSRYHQPSA